MGRPRRWGHSRDRKKSGATNCQEEAASNAFVIPASVSRVRAVPREEILSAPADYGIALNAAEEADDQYPDEDDHRTTPRIEISMG